MRRLLIAAATAAILSGGTAEAGSRHYHHEDSQDFRFNGFNSFEVDDARFEIEGKEIYITHLAQPREEIRITSEYKMYLDGKEIVLDENQRRTVGEFYELSFEVRREAKGIAKEGLRIGLKGAKLGAKALGGVMKMFFTSYTEEDLDREMDMEAEKIEAYAEELEKRAEKLEEMAERWEDLGLQMKDEIPALAEMDWL